MKENEREKNKVLFCLFVFQDLTVAVMMMMLMMMTIIKKAKLTDHNEITLFEPVFETKNEIV